MRNPLDFQARSYRITARLQWNRREHCIGDGFLQWRQILRKQVRSKQTRIQGWGQDEKVRHPDSRGALRDPLQPGCAWRPQVPEYTIAKARAWGSVSWWHAYDQTVWLWSFAILRSDCFWIRSAKSGDGWTKRNCALHGSRGDLRSKIKVSLCCRTRNRYVGVWNPSLWDGNCLQADLGAGLQVRFRPNPIRGSWLEKTALTRCIVAKPNRKVFVNKTVDADLGKWSSSARLVEGWVSRMPVNSLSLGVLIK